MAVKTIFYGDDTIEMEVYLNTNQGLCIGVYDAEVEVIRDSAITLDIDDVKELIKVLTELAGRMTKQS